METIPRVQHDSDLLRTITKPIDDIDKLIRYLAPKCNQMLMNGRRNIGIVKENQHQCLVLLRGTMSLYRNNDGLIINSETSPFIFGMNSQLRYSRHIYLRTQETSSIGLISINEAHKIIAEQQLWENVTRLLEYSSAKVYAHCFKVSKLSCYEIIVHQLVELNNEPEAIKNKITAANYILSRTFLSRSGVMRTLAKLKQLGAIQLHRGILVTMNQLPPSLKLSE
ncbi:helix-turn-helix domain-containing protein [Klebsiella michiganensis]|uniref:helix-turn-helix domain-containing protein n=1 Tax=Klebsiella michiganensis TaxID=1134687 RepID=UPI003970AF3D